MKKLAFLLLPFFLSAGGVAYKGDIGFEADYISHDTENKRDNSLALRLNLELKKNFGDGEVVAKVKGVWDKDDKERRYIELSDLYYRYNFENSDILVGRNTRFWGALEFYNITDIFNTKDWLDDPFDYDSKLGSWNVAYTHYFDSSELSLIVKLKEQKQNVQDTESVNNFFPLPYDDDLQTQKSENRPSIYLKYSGSGEEIQLDYSLIYENGYDNQRYMSVKNGKLRQNAYLVDKFLAYATLVSGESIYKAEASYTISDDEKVSDYGQVGFGVEYTLYGLWDKKDLGLLAEYYRYEVKDDDKLEISNLFKDDLTLGFRLSINDASSSEVLGGVDLDMDNHEKIYFVEYDTRILDKYKLELSYQHLSPKSESVFQKLDRMQVQFGYYF
jgi:hypothetical protein